ncbi:MAG: hypothetical protein QNK37_06990 [Acidobacteriota bacterium]|nr:hypothetical protein [Acidobacteriota bacterium]
MSKKNTDDRVFAEDEMNLIDVRADWSPEELLAVSGIFFLKDVAGILNIDSTRIKKRVRNLIEKKREPWKVMGVRKVWNHWMIRMKVFAPYYRRNFTQKTREVAPDWDGNDILKQEGLFYLTDVCKLIPCTPQQIRYQAKRRADARGEMGVWKDEGARGYVVDMAVFGPWFRSEWNQSEIVQAAMPN